MDLPHIDLSVYASQEIDENNSSFNSQPNYNTTTTTTTDNNDKQITFFNYTHGYCVGIIDIVDSTKITQEIASSNKIQIIILYFSTPWPL